MNNQEIFKKVASILSQIIKCDLSEINESTSANDIDRWDSLTHVHLVLAVEKEFEIRFSLGELQDLQNVKDMVLMVENKKSI
jgi:acyl carrier protein